MMNIYVSIWFYDSFKYLINRIENIPPSNSESSAGDLSIPFFTEAWRLRSAAPNCNVVQDLVGPLWAAGHELVSRSGLDIGLSGYFHNMKPCMDMGYSTHSTVWWQGATIDASLSQILHPQVAPACSFNAFTHMMRKCIHKCRCASVHMHHMFHFIICYMNINISILISHIL